MCLGSIWQGMQGREVWLLKLAGVDSPEAADMLKGLRLLMRLRDRPALDSEDDFYVQDLVGMQVCSSFGRSLPHAALCSEAAGASPGLLGGTLQLPSGTLQCLSDRPALDSADGCYVQDIVGMQVSSSPEHVLCLPLQHVMRLWELAQVCLEACR